MVLFFSHYQLILIPLWPVLWDYKVPIFEVPIMGTFTNSDVASSSPFPRNAKYCPSSSDVPLGVLYCWRPKTGWTWLAWDDIVSMT